MAIPEHVFVLRFAAQTHQKRGKYLRISTHIRTKSSFVDGGRLNERDFKLDRNDNFE